MLEEKFSKYSPFIYYNTRKCFKGVSIFIIKYYFRYNYHDERSKIMNYYTSNKYVAFSEQEDQEHILKFSANKKLQDQQYQKLQKNILNNEKNYTLKNDTLMFANDIRNYLNSVNNIPGIQNIIRFKILFCRCLVHNQFRSNPEEIKYSFMNELIIKSYVIFYNEYQKEQNNRVYEDNNKKIVLLNKIKGFLANYANTDKICIKEYLINCPSNMSICSIDYIKKQII